jgi:hypothetical protein
MTTFPQDFILSEEHSLDTAHETTSFTVQVAVHFLLEGRLVEVSGANCDAESNGFFCGLAADVLEDGEGGVDTAAFLEEGADCATGALGGNEDDVDVRWGDDTGEVLVDDGEPMGEVESLTLELERKIIVHLALGQERLEGFPRFLLSGVLPLVSQPISGQYRKEIHDDCALLDGFLDLEEVLSGDPAILDGLIPRSSVLANTDNDVHSIITKIQSLAMSSISINRDEISYP